jgi:ABC-type siderophore export system fused ATPase/permease subunit
MVDIIIAIITAVATITNTVISKMTSKKVETIQDIKEDFKKEIQTIQKQHKEEIDKHILEADKTYLTNFLSEIENGVKKSEIQIRRAYEVYEEYKSKNGNSYVHDKWEELVGNGKL